MVILVLYLKMSVVSSMIGRSWNVQENIIKYLTSRKLSNGTSRRRSSITEQMDSELELKIAFTRSKYMWCVRRPERSGRNKRRSYKSCSIGYYRRSVIPYLRRDRLGSHGLPRRCDYGSSLWGYSCTVERPKLECLKDRCGFSLKTVVRAIHSFSILSRENPFRKIGFFLAKVYPLSLLSFFLYIPVRKVCVVVVHTCVRAPTVDSLVIRDGRFAKVFEWRHTWRSDHGGTLIAVYKYHRRYGKRIYFFNIFDISKC